MHEGLSALFEHRMSRLAPISFSFASNDYGFELLSADEPPLEQALSVGLLSPATCCTISQPRSTRLKWAKRQFRELARVAG